MDPTAHDMCCGSFQPGLKATDMCCAPGLQAARPDQACSDAGAWSLQLTHVHAHPAGPFPAATHATHGAPAPALHAGQIAAAHGTTVTARSTQLVVCAVYKLKITELTELTPHPGHTQFILWRTAVLGRDSELLGNCWGTTSQN